MPKRGENRITVNMGCEECKERTYHTSKNRRNDPDRIEFKKFCPRCKRHVTHREIR